jgi:predicted site-specific integrase-resolvase
MSMVRKFRDAPKPDPRPAAGNANRLRLTQRDLADRWQISTRTLERWRWSGAGPRYLKIGARVIYRLEDIEAFEAARLRSAGIAR